VKCERAEELLLEYLYGEAGPDEVREIEAHLAECPECSAKLASLGRIRTLAADLPDPEPSRVVTGRIIAQAREDAENRRSVWGRGWVKIAGLLCVMVAAVMLALPQFQSSRNAPGPVSVVPRSDGPAGEVSLRGGVPKEPGTPSSTEEPAPPEPVPPPASTGAGIKLREVSTDTPAPAEKKKEPEAPSSAAGGLDDSEAEPGKPSKPAEVAGGKPSAEIQAKVMSQDQLAKLDEALRKKGAPIEVIEKGKDEPGPVAAQAPAEKPAVPKAKPKPETPAAPSPAPPPRNEKLEEKPKSSLNHVKDARPAGEAPAEIGTQPGDRTGDTAVGRPVETAGLPRKSRSLAVPQAPLIETKAGPETGDLNLAEKALAAGRYKEAVAKFQAIVDRLPSGHPDRARACLGLARAWEGLGDAAKAISAYQILARESPSHKDLAQRRIRELANQ
jgi:TolA-binding protein